MKTLAAVCIIVLLAGAVLGGFFERLAAPWKRLADAPEPVLSLRVLPGGTIVAETADGTVYSCTRSTVDCWDEATPGQTLEYSGQSEDCWLLTRVLFSVAQLDTRIQHCQALDSAWGGGTLQNERIVLDGTGRIWYQRWIKAPFEAAAFLMMSAVVGLAFGALALLGRRNRHARRA